MGKRKVLVVDDEMHLRIFIATVYETGGYEVFTARDGVDGLAKACEVQPDLISLDLMMPREGGVQLFSRLRQDPVLKRVPVVIVSAIAGATFAHCLHLLEMSLGADYRAPEGYVEKPPQPEALLAAAAQALGG
jgi:CheY-like chemotaxis protein